MAAERLREEPDHPVSSTALTAHTWHAETSSRDKKTSEDEVIDDIMNRRQLLM